MYIYERKLISMAGKSIYQIAMENNVSKSKVRGVILRDLGWSMDRFQSRLRHNQILIGEDDEKEIVEKLQPLLQKRVIAKESLAPIVERIDFLIVELTDIKRILAGLQ